MSFVQSHNDEFMVGNLNALEERGDMVSMRLVDYQQMLAQRYNRKARPRDFVSRDLILQKAIRSIKYQNTGKLAQIGKDPTE